MDNQADTILDSDGSTTNEPNCATQLASRNCAHPVDQLGSRFTVASEQHLHRFMCATADGIHRCMFRTGLIPH